MTLPLRTIRTVWPVTFLLCCLAMQASADAADAFLSERNREVPFSYLVGGTRSWPFLEERLPANTRVSFVATQDQKILAEGEQIRFSGLRVRLNAEQKLEVVSEKDQPPQDFTLGITLHLPDGAVETQTISVRPAPPNRPISYVADFGDDLIKILVTSKDAHWQVATKCSFDQYFRRCQAHGVDRLIIWLTGFPLICDPENYATEDWNRFEKQTRALLDSELLDTLIHTRKQKSFKENGSAHVLPWGWNRKLCELRLQRNLGTIISQSAIDHGIRLTASFRPFEPALSKYYEIPTFDSDGNYLWSFLPFASPVVNYHPDETCFAHFRTVLNQMGLKQMGHEAAGQISIIDVPGVKNADAFLKRFHSQRDNLQISASNFPPQHEDSLVLQRQPDGEFRLRPFKEFQKQAEQRQTILTDYQVVKHGDGVRITNLQIPAELRFLILSNPSAAEEALDLPTDVPVQMIAKAGNRLDRGLVYWALDQTLDPEGLTRAANIPQSGSYHSEFKAVANFQKITKDGPERLPLKGHQVVIDMGASWSVEMLDLNRSAMRANVLKEMATLLKFPAFDELYISTRTHISLPYSVVDGEDGLQPIVQYRRSGRKIHSYLGIDRAFAPIAAANDSVLQAWASDKNNAKNSVEKLTTWQTNEWRGPCQSEDSEFRWRYVRNREVAKGVRLLLQDLEKAFPEVRTRIVLPLREKAVLGAKDELEVAVDSEGKPFGRDYSRVWSSINYADHIGEGMTMLDLSGLSTEPVLFGVRGLPESKPLEIYLRHNFADLADNFGSSFRGPRSFFFEAQASLRHKDYAGSMRRRGEIACECLAHTSEVSEVIYYEAADWLYYLPLSKPDVCSHAYVENCTLHTTEKSKSRADQEAPWAMFRGNAQHTGLSPRNGPQTATQQWALRTGEKAPTSAVVGADGMIYAGIYDNSLYAIHPDGRVKWKFATAGVMRSSPAVTPDGIVYTPDHDGTLYAINPDGTQRWTYPLGSTVYASPTLGPDGTIYQGSDNGKLHAITPDGKAKWTYTTDSVIQSTAAVGNDGTIFVGANDHRLYAIHPDGTEKWTFKTGGVIESSPAVGNDGTVYVGSVDTCLHAINADGTKRWKFKTGGAIYCSPGIASDGSLIVGSFDHNVYCVRPDGTEKWSYKTKGGVSSSPAIGADGIIYIVSRDNLLHAINQAGTPRWQFPLPGTTGRSPAIGFNQTLYISGTDGVLYAIGPKLK